MSQGVSYWVVASGMAAGFSLIQFVMTKINQRRQSRRIEQGIAEYLRRRGEKE
jgi:hypothetical protein